MTATWQIQVVMPNVDGYTLGPARVLSLDAEPTALYEAVRASLADADRDDAPEYAAALSDAGVDLRLLDGGAQVTVEELSDGTVWLTGNGISGGRRTADHTWHGRIENLAEACAAAAQMIRTLPTQHLPPGTPTGSSFGYKCSWLAVHGRSLDEVTIAVGLADTRAATWDVGVNAAYNDEVFISPPTAGWVFVVSAGWPFDGLAVAALSSRLDTVVQYFGTRRVSEYHEWAYAVGGRLIRRLVCEGSSGTFEQEGAPTPVEIELGVAAMRLGRQRTDRHASRRILEPRSDHSALGRVERTHGRLRHFASKAVALTPTRRCTDYSPVCPSMLSRSKSRWPQ